MPTSEADGKGEKRQPDAGTEAVASRTCFWSSGDDGRGIDPSNDWDCSGEGQNRVAESGVQHKPIQPAGGNVVRVAPGGQNPPTGLKKSVK